jgi:hypothetical protein
MRQASRDRRENVEFISQWTSLGQWSCAAIGDALTCAESDRARQIASIPTEVTHTNSNVPAGRQPTGRHARRPTIACGTCAAGSRSRRAGTTDPSSIQFLDPRGWRAAQGLDKTDSRSDRRGVGKVSSDVRRALCFVPAHVMRSIRNPRSDARSRAVGSRTNSKPSSTPCPPGFGSSIRLNRKGGSMP